MMKPYFKNGEEVITETFAHYMFSYRVKGNKSFKHNKSPMFLWEICLLSPHWVIDTCKLFSFHTTSVIQQKWSEVSDKLPTTEGPVEHNSHVTWKTCWKSWEKKTANSSEKMYNYILGSVHLVEEDDSI